MTDTEPFQKAVDAIAKQVKESDAIEKIIEERDSSRNVINLIVVAMETAESLKSLDSGQERARAVKRALFRDDVLELLPESVRSNLKALEKSEMLDSIMTVVCKAAKGKLKINERLSDIRDKVFSAFRACCQGN